MNKLNAHRTGLGLGIFAGVMHLIWSFVVASGAAQGLVNWVEGLHFISEPVTILPFSAGTALELIIVGVIVGYVLGYIFAFCWNWGQR